MLTTGKVGGITMTNNPLGLNGIEFIEFSSPRPQDLEVLFQRLGFSFLFEHSKNKVKLYQQGDINFLLNSRPGSFAESFYWNHGPCVPSMGWRVENAAHAMEHAMLRGATPAVKVDYQYKGVDLPAIEGIGGSLIYFIDKFNEGAIYPQMGFTKTQDPIHVEHKGFLRIDHLTNNVYKGMMAEISNFYKNVFGFVEIRYFDIRGIKTGLTSFALRSPCGKFAIPINEGTEKKSQINEYLDDYKGPGVQHIALLSEDLLKSLSLLEGSSIETLDIDSDYYDTVFDRVPNVTESHEEIRTRNVLVDGDEKGYLLQIFTKNVIGPIFFEMIQRKDNDAFGEGNFGALFRAIERDQERRGFL
jgi:4-hydroxyphenylpyruvate dioxygenase